MRAICYLQKNLLLCLVVATLAVMLISTPLFAKPSKITISQGVDPVTLDPQFAESGPLGNILAMMFDRLVDLDRDVQVKLLLAESMTLLDDKKTYRIKIRKGIKFWNGKPLNAHAAKYTFDRMSDANLRKQGLNDPFPKRVGLDHVKLIDDYTIDVVLKKPNIIFPLFLAFVQILEPGYYSSHTPQETAIKPMGSGPWMFKEWIKDDHITVVANPNYWRGKPHIDEVTYRPVAEKSTRLAMLETGEIDIAVALGPEDLPFIKENKNLRITKSGGRRMGIHIPLGLEVYRDRRVRYALNHAVDFAAINKHILSNLADSQLRVPLLGKFWTAPDIKGYDYDPQKAKQLLKEAGFPMDRKITIYTPNGRYVKDIEIAEAVAGYFRDLGLKAFAKPLEWSVFTKKLRSRTFDDIYMIGLGSRYNGPQDLNIVMPTSAYDITDWTKYSENGPAFVKLYKKMEKTFELEKQQAQVWELSRLWVKEAPWIPLWNMVTIFGVNKRINWEANPRARINLYMVGEDSIRITK
jgi:peptide/nickel transport system substrate-binding protein